MKDQHYGNETAPTMSATAPNPPLHLGAWRTLCGVGIGSALQLPAQHLLTNAVVLGAAGCGKTGLVTVLAEEALNAGIPTIAIDVKSELPSLLLSFPSFEPRAYAPWDDAGPGSDSPSALEVAGRQTDKHRQALWEWSIDETHLRDYCNSTFVRVMTPGASAGEALNLLSALERPSLRWNSEPESARRALSAAVSLLLHWLGRDYDPATSREHLLLRTLAECRLSSGREACVMTLLRELDFPAISSIGSHPIDSGVTKEQRCALGAALRNWIGSPTYSLCRQGSSLDVSEWTTPKNGRTPAVIVSVAHLEDAERSLVLAVVLEEILSWVRGLKSTSQLNTLLVLDEVRGLLPPHPAYPPTKRPLLSLLEQARGFGVGVVVATRNPRELDGRALSNSGLWCLGRHDNATERAKVLDGLAFVNLPSEFSKEELHSTLQRLAPRWFLVRSTLAPNAEPFLMCPRQTMSLMRGPMTRTEILQARQGAIGAERLQRAPDAVSRTSATLPPVPPSYQ